MFGVPLWLMLAAAAADPQSGCSLEGPVVRAPGERPARILQQTWTPPSVKYVRLPVGEARGTVTVRVDERGNVTAACVEPTVSEVFHPALLAAARQLKFEPAMDHGRAVSTIATVSYRLPSRPPLEGLLERIASSDDVPWLERLASSLDAAQEEFRRQPRKVGQVKDLRTDAYVRLGEIGTSDSLAAVRRVEEAFTRMPPTAEPAPLPREWVHPGWHMGDGYYPPLARVDAPDGRTYAVVSGDFLGPWAFYLQWRSASAPAGTPWSRPRLTGIVAPRYLREAELAWTSAGLVLTFTVTRPAGSSSASPTSRSTWEDCGYAEGPHRFTIDPRTVVADMDGDGWTDLEEASLGTKASDRDSDGDGIADGADVTPTVRADSSGEAADDLRILQRALFAAFGVSGSRWALLADRSSPKLQLSGLGGPVVYDREPPHDPDACVGGVYVKWKIGRQTATEAVVEVTDWEGFLAAGGQEIFLRKIDGDWYVVARQTTWVS